MMEWVGLPSNSVEAIQRRAAHIKGICDQYDGLAGYLALAAPFLDLETARELMAMRRNIELDMCELFYKCGYDVDVAGIFQLHQEEIAAEKAQDNA